MKELILLFLAYAAGNCMTGPLLFGRKIRQEGSGNAGARNAGRLFGKKAFVLTFLGDALKGAAVVLAAKWFGFPPVWQLIAATAAVLGHVFPAVFKFRGGKGMSTFIGGVLAFSPLVFAAFACVFLIMFAALFRSATMGGMAAVASLPLLVLLFSHTVPTFIASGVLALIVVYAHLDNIKEKWFAERTSQP